MRRCEHVVLLTASEARCSCIVGRALGVAAAYPRHVLEGVRHLGARALLLQLLQAVVPHAKLRCICHHRGSAPLQLGEGGGDLQHDRS